MKLRTGLIISLFICLLVIGSVSAADNGTDDVVSSELNKDSISHADKDVIDKQLDTLKESGISEKINENEKDVIEEKSTENSIKSLKNNDNTLGNTENTWTDIHYPDVFEVQLSSTEITLGESVKYTLSHNDGSYEGNYIYIFIDDALYKKTSLHGTTCKSIDAIYGLTAGQHKIEFKREYGVFDMSKWDIVNPRTSYSPSFYITVKSPQSPTTSTTSTSSSSTSTSSKTKKTTKYQMKKVKMGKTYKYGKYKGKFSKKQRNNIINAKTKVNLKL